MFWKFRERLSKIIFPEAGKVFQNVERMICRVLHSSLQKIETVSQHAYTNTMLV